MKLVNTTQRTQFRQMKQLYMEAFPPAERRPFRLLRKKTKERLMEMLSIEDQQHNFVGMVVMILYKDIALLDYFAIVPDYRGKGIGSQILQELKKRYSEKRLVLEIEDPDEQCENREERMRRRNFYLNNGMTMLEDFMVNLFGTRMRILTHDSYLNFEEYQGIYINTFGEKVREKVIYLPIIS